MEADTEVPEAAGPPERRGFRWLLLLAAALLVAPPAAAAEEPAPPDLKAMTALAEAWFAAKDDESRREVEERARAVPPLPADAVEEVAAMLFDLAAKGGPRLPRKSRGTFYEGLVAERGRKRKAEWGEYLLHPGKRGGGLLVAMHGGGENSGDAGTAMSTWGSASSLGLTVIAPQAIDLVSSAWNEEKQDRFVVDLVDAARRTFDIDTNRVYLAGHSMGGDGSWMVGGRHADRIAAAAPLAGSVMPYMAPGALNRLETPRKSYQGLTEGVLPNLMHLHYWIFHSDDDRNEAIHPDDIATDRLKALQGKFPGKYDFVYDRVTGNGHALPKGGVKPILKWLVGHERVPHPEEVVWETWWKRKHRMYWLWSRGHDDSWRFHARVTGPNRVEVTATTKPLQGRATPKEVPLTLLLTPTLFDLGKPLVVTSRGRTLHEGPVPRSFWAMLVSIAPRNDPEQWYEAHLDLKVPRRIWWDLWDPEPAD